MEEVCQHYSGMYIARGIRLKYGIPNPDFFKHKTWYKGLHYLKLFMLAKLPSESIIKRFYFNQGFIPE